MIQRGVKAAFRMMAVVAVVPRSLSDCECDLQNPAVRNMCYIFPRNVSQLAQSLFNESRPYLSSSSCCVTCKCQS